ncbi:YdiU family protein [Rhodoferax lacus]|uniref:Protein nucleotidyltransferase YdiU n=1 Tax=Rhodoferax lacus TaxID=2184758 RepID=A0A3E1RH02_9BURK|nr:YdiU family protein [Rhodoferax lacus]RFO98639.1 YdiU family protein [Rhodoferax lacus]
MPVSTPTEAPVAPTLSWQHSFAALGESFYVPLGATPLPAPYWVGHNAALGTELGLPADWSQSESWLQALTGNTTLPGSQPLASVYSGHQFGNWAGQLGDGRAILLGEAKGLEWQLKGAGLTPFSRMGDGRAVLRSSVREFLCSEAMHGLGIPSTRALCVTGSDAPVRRETLETAAVVTRLAPSFIRFGHFEHFCHTDQHGELKRLADYVIDRFYPACRSAADGDSNPYVALLAAVTERTAQMVAHWQAVGFCHGVMNTDNMSILGLTIDYGPFQFLDGFQPGHICNHSDHQGRYAFNKQPNVAYWNLYCLGQALLPLIEEQEQAIAALETFKTHFPQALGQRFGAKLGLQAGQMAPQELVDTLLQLLASEAVDYTIFWRRLSHWTHAQSAEDASVRDLFVDRAAIDAWLLAYGSLHALAERPQASRRMLAANPKFVLRNHLGELAIRAARQKDFSVLAQLQSVLQAPFDEHPEHQSFADFAPDWAAGIEISCSS